MLVSVHADPVIGVEAAPVTMVTRFFSLAIGITARAAEVVTRSVIMSTPSRSNHSRALLEATSPLFWWSADRTSTEKGFLFAAWKSSTAIFAAMTAPGPARSEYRPERSVRTPIFTTLSESFMPAGDALPACAKSDGADEASAAPTSNESSFLFMASLLLKRSNRSHTEQQ